MRPSDALPKYRDTFRTLVASSNMTNPRVFGSVLHGDDTEASDLDLLVDPTGETSLFDLTRLQIAMERISGLKIDLLTPKFLPAKFRADVLQEAEPL